MRIAIVADVHANLEAFQAVLAHAARDGTVDELWCLGDIVGYGPAPSECIALLHEFPHVSIAGNHDYAATGVVGTEEFNPYAAEAVRWTAKQLSLEDQLWLANLPASLVEGEFTLTHGSLQDPVWEYLVTPAAASGHLKRQSTLYGLVGHSHIPCLFTQEVAGLEDAVLADGDEVSLGSAPFVANPGSVGQPRDGDPRAAYGLLDTERRLVRFHRVPYDVEATQAKMRSAGLPDYLSERLSMGR